MTETEYRAALARIEELFDAEMNTPQGDELDALIERVMDHEKYWDGEKTNGTS